jgi:hypothetical protein
MKPNEQKLKSEFVEFQTDPGSSPPVALALQIRREIEQNLEPTPTAALFQGFSLHAVSGAVTLLFCPQFGIGPFGGGKGLMGFVEAYGHLVCGLFCGAFFMSLTAVLMPVVLDRPVRKVLSRHPLAMAGLWTLSSLFALLLVALMARGEVPHLHAEFLVAWILAASLSAYAGIFRPRFQ